VPFFDRVDNFIGDALSDVAAAEAASAAATHAPGPAPTGPAPTGPAPTGPASTGPAGILRIDPDRVDDAINVFQGAVDKLELRVQDAAEQIKAKPMAVDGVSEPAAAAFNHASLSGKGAAIEAWMGAVEQLRLIIVQLKAQKVTNLRVDDAVAQPFATASGTVS
jgi:hypothetical protein